MKKLSLKVVIGLGISLVTCFAQPSLSSQSSQASKSNYDRKDQPGGREILSSIGTWVTDSLRDAVGIDASNVSDWDSTQSPRHTLFTFYTGMDGIYREGIPKYRKVDQTLPEGYTYQHPETRALKKVLDRLAPLNPLNFPDTSNDPHTKITDFEVFPYAIKHQWVWEQLGKAPEGEIHLIKNSGENGWQFSEKTMQGAPALLESMKSIPPVYPGSGQHDLLQSVFQPMVDKTPFWGWLVLTGSLIIGIISGRYAKNYLYKLGDKLERKTRPVVGSIFRSIGVSVAIIVGTIIFILGSSFVHFSEVFSEIYWQIIEGILLVAILWLILGATDLISTLMKTKIRMKNDEFGAMTITILHRVVNTMLYTILVFFLLENIFSLNVGALITGLGIIGLALSLAGKETAQNLFGAISIFVNRPFVVGDWIEFKGNLGEVEDVRMQATYVRLLSGEVLVIPNMQFVSTEVENLGMRKYIRREMNITLPYGTPADKIAETMELLKDILTREEITKEGFCNLEERPPSVNFSDFGDYYINIKVYYWYFIGDEGEDLQRNEERGWFSYLEHCTLVNQTILRDFAEHNIDFAFPTQSIEFRNQPKPPAKTAEKSSVNH